MNSEEIIVKNEPMCVDKPCGRKIQSLKREISTQQQSRANTFKTTSKRSKLPRQYTQCDKESPPIEIQVKNEPATYADDESLSISSNPMVAISFMINTDEPAESMIQVKPQTVKRKIKSKKTKKIK